MLIKNVQLQVSFCTIFLKSCILFAYATCLQGCLELLSRSGVSIKGKKAVVVGRSNIVGLPASLLLLKADATVTIVHSHTSQPENIVREADIVIAAAGQAKMVTSLTNFTLSACLLCIYVQFLSTFKFRWFFP